MKAICVLSDSETMQLFGGILPTCRQHRHVSRLEAQRMIVSKIGNMVGAKQLVRTDRGKSVTGILQDGSIVKLEMEQAKRLVEHGHCTWIKRTLVQFLKNVPMGAGLSLLVGKELAIAATKREPWAIAAVSDIVGRKGV